jgi:hypothetical protein
MKRTASPPRSTASSPRLTVVEPGVTGLQPPRPLGPAGRALWDQVCREFDMSDTGGQQMLCLAAEVLDRAEALGEAIRNEGVMVGGRPHAALREELSARNLASRLLARLGLDVEPLRTVGGPTKSERLGRR